MHAKAAHPKVPFAGSESPKQHKNDNDDQDGAYDADAEVTETVDVPTEAATEATKQEDNEDDDPNDMALLPFAVANLNLDFFARCCQAPDQLSEMPTLPKIISMSAVFFRV